MRPAGARPSGPELEDPRVVGQNRSQMAAGMNCMHPISSETSCSSAWNDTGQRAFIEELRGEPKSGPHLELFLREERAVMDAVHGPTVAAVDEGGLTHDIRAVAFLTAVGVAGTAVPGRRPYRDEPHDGGPGALARRLGWSRLSRGLHEPGRKDTSSRRIMKTSKASTEALFIRQHG